MKNKKKLAVMATMMVLSGYTAFAAGNYGDTPFTYNFSSSIPIGGWVTSARAKQDDTSSYMKCKVAPTNYKYKASVYGAYSNGIYESVGSPQYTFAVNTTKYMINYVKEKEEKNYTHARIFAVPDIASSWTASGVWSPDSI